MASKRSLKQQQKIEEYKKRFRPTSVRPSAGEVDFTYRMRSGQETGRYVARRNSRGYWGMEIVSFSTRLQPLEQLALQSLAADILNGPLLPIFTTEGANA